jgi:outer membrane protein OmpA-like peptidoglycan-associated protein
MKKFLLILPILVSVAACSYESETHVQYMQAEQQESFFFKGGATEMFKKIDCDGQADALIQIAKTQIGRDRKTDVYSKLLAMEYLDLATYEYYDMGDKLDGTYFFTKATNAAKGNYPLPEDLSDWKVSRKNYEELKWAREDFMSMVYNEGLVNDPVNMAKAQVAYDCWIEQQSEGLQELDTRICKKEFKDRMAKAYNVLNGNVSKSDIEIMLAGLRSDNNAQYLETKSVINVYAKIFPSLAVVEEPEILYESPVEKAIDDVVEIMPVEILEDPIKKDIEVLPEEVVLDPTKDKVELLYEEIALDPADRETQKLGSLMSDLEEIDELAEVDYLAENGSILLESVEESEIEIAMVEDSQYNVYFDWSFTKPSNGDKEKIQQVVENFNKGKYSGVILKAYADKSGPDNVNQRVSEVRGRTVKRMLVAEGIDESIISYIAFGESATPGPDGLRNADYRKVIIIFK